MKESPTLFSAPMVRAIFNGSKTQTRRVVKDLPPWEITEIARMPAALDCGCRTVPRRPGEAWLQVIGGRAHTASPVTPRVREAWSHDGPDLETLCIRLEDTSGSAGDTICYAPYHHRALPGTLTWRPSIHMPRRASRMLLEIVSVRVERLQEINSLDADAEGVAE